MASYNVGLLFGGRSKHEASIKSAMSIIVEMQSYSATYRIRPFYIDRTGFWHEENDSWRVLQSGKSLNKTERLNRPGNCPLPHSAADVDVWLPALHGPYGEDCTIQRLLTLVDAPFVGAGVLGSAVDMDKWLMKKTFDQADLPQMHYVGLDIHSVRDENSWDQDLLTSIEESLDYPCSIRPANPGSSDRISHATNRQALVEALNLAASYDRRLVVEQGSKQRFRKLACGILGNANPRASPVGETLCSNPRFEIPAKIPKEVSQQVQAMAVRAFQAVEGQGLARVDFFYADTENKLFINEINTMPSLTALSLYSSLWKAAGLDFPALLYQLLGFAISSEVNSTTTAVDPSMLCYDSARSAEHGEAERA